MTDQQVKSDRLISRHWTRSRANLEATERMRKMRGRGQSSGWARVRVAVKKVRGLRRWAVVER